LQDRKTNKKIKVLSQDNIKIEASEESLGSDIDQAET